MARENTDLRRQLNKIQFIGLKGIKVGDALAVDTWHFRRWTREIIANFEFTSVPEYGYKAEEKKVDKVFVFPYTHMERKDQLQKFKAVEEAFDHKAVIIIHKEKSMRNPYLSFIPFWYMQMKGLKYSPVVKKGICYKLCEALGHAGAVFQIVRRMKEVNKIIFFFDVSSIENILTQFCNQQGYLTYTLQHGIINGSYDYIEYRCSHAKYFLAWGEYTKRMAMHYGMAESKIKVVGSINELAGKAEHKKIQIKDDNFFLLCTNGVINRNAWDRNREMIMLANQIASEYNMKYYLKVHPTDNADSYIRIADPKYCEKIVNKQDPIFDVLNKVRFTLCGNSTVFCDSIYCGIPAFRYITPQNKKLDVCKGIAFGRVDGYEKLKSELDIIQQEEKQYRKRLEEIKAFLFEPGDSVEKYKRVIEENT